MSSAAAGLFLSIAQHPSVSRVAKSLLGLGFEKYCIH